MAPNPTPTDLCPDDRMAAAVAATGSSEAEGLAAAEALLTEYPGDPRLHFLRGSLLAGLQRYPEAQAALQGAIAIAPGFALARYQLGFLQFTSANPVAALATWGPLHDLPEGNYLRLFAQGLTFLAGDDIVPALEALRQGLTANTENPAMNRDIQLLIGEVEKLAGGAAPDATGEPPTDASADEPTSAASLLLQQFTGKATKH